jgi:hypothetical protein
MKKLLLIALLSASTATLAFAQHQGRPNQLTAEARVEKRITRLDESLDLTPQQKEILQKDMLRLEKKRDETRDARMGQRKNQQNLRDEELAMLKKTLTAAQLKKHDELRAARSLQQKNRKALPHAPEQKQAE